MKNFLHFQVGLILLFSCKTSFCQKIGVDSKGQSVFTHISQQEARVELSADEPVSLSYLFFPRTSIYKLVRNNLTTVTKVNGMLAQISMVNSDEFVVFNNLGQLEPGVGLKVGYQSTVEKFANIDQIPKKYLGVKTWGVNLIYKMDNFKLYDPSINQINREKPNTFGVEGNYSLFLRNGPNKPSSFRAILALNANYLIKTWNNDELINYQKIEDVTVLPTVVALEDFDGKYGTLKTDNSSFRLAMSVPIYYSIFNPIPYFVLVTKKDNNPQYRMGLFTNILNKSLANKNFSIPTGIGLGIETTYTKENFGKAVFFLKGSISIDEKK